MEIQVWLHQLHKKHTARREQTHIARQLVDLACNFNGLDLGKDNLELPGLELIELVDKKYCLALSISHCRTLVVVALTEGLLGIDCEAMGRRRNWLEMAHNFFTAGEADYIKNTGQRERAFLEHWVVKESFIKAIKGSVFGDLNRLVIDADFRAAKLDTPAHEDLPWWVWEGCFAESIMGLSCSMPARPELVFFEIPVPINGSYTRCDDLVSGNFLPITTHDPVSRGNDI